VDPTQPHLPTVRQLRYFVALTEERHFGRAARRCFVSQSGFSTAIRELESLLDTQLADRTNRRVTITAAGQEIAVLARLCLRDLATLVESARGLKAPMQGNLQLGVIPTIAPFLLPRVLPKLRATYPALKIWLQEDTTSNLHDKLMDGTLDLVLLALPYDLPGTEVKSLFRDRFLLAAREGTKLVDPQHYRFSRLDAGSVLLLREGHCLREHAIAACRIRNTEKVATFSASSLLTLIEMVDADLGITFLPEMAVGSALLRETRVRTFPMKENSFRTIGLVWRRGSARRREFEELAEFFAELNPAENA
jgi:LysR family hydrogen peroxide-inducible transcriptional activator